MDKTLKIIMVGMAFLIIAGLVNATVIKDDISVFQDIDASGDLNGTAIFEGNYRVLTSINASSGLGNSSWNESRANEIRPIHTNLTVNDILGFGFNYTSDLNNWFAKIVDVQSWIDGNRSELEDNISLKIDKVDEPDLSVNNSNNSDKWDAYDVASDIYFNNLTWMFGDDWNYISGGSFFWNESKLSTVYYNATTNETVTGTPQGVIDYLRVYDGIPFNVSEDTSDLELRINFSIGVNNTFNQLIVRYKSAEEDIVTHDLFVQIYEPDEDEWGDYGTLPLSPGYSIVQFGVFDPDEHIDSTGVVQVRFYQDEGVPGKTHKHNFDWVTIAKGFGTPSGEEVDPIFKDWLNQPVLTTDLNTTSGDVYGDGTGNIYGYDSVNASIFYDDGVFLYTSVETMALINSNTTYLEGLIDGVNGSVVLLS